MAKGQQQGVSAMTVGLVAFAGLWLAATVLLVTLYTNQSGLKDTVNRAKEDVSRLITDAERKAIPLFQQAKAGGPTVAGLLEGARGRTAELATGEKGDDAAAVKSKLETLLAMIRSDRIVPDADRFENVPYLSALTMLYEAFAAEHAILSEAQQRVAELEGEADRLVRVTAEQKAELDRQARQISDQLASVEADRSKFRQERDQQVAKLESDFEKARALTESDLTKERQTTQELRKKLGKLEGRLSTFTEKLSEVMPGPDRLAAAREPDGRILTAFPGDPLVYIDLGRKDRLVLGLQFAVYSASDGIPESGRSKGAIRVASTDASSAACEILRVREGAAIVAGDLIANPIYRRDRSVNFAVVGDFDLQHTGVPSPDEATLVEAMITDWGGTVTRDVSAMTDFLVVGAAPRKPKTSADLSPEEASRAAARQQAYDHYLSVVKEANTLSIPIMNQEVFLNFLGFHEQLARR